MKITNPITLDVARSNSYICLLAKQFDENSRFLIATLTNNGAPMIIPAGAAVTLRATRPDGEPVAVPGIINNDGTTTVEIDDYILEVVGSASLSIEVAIGDEILTSASFNLTIQRADGNGWLRVYVAAASLAAGNYYITIGDTPYAFTTTQAIPAGGSVYFASEGGTAQTRDASGNVLDASLTLTAGTSGTELTSDVPTMSFLTAIAGRMATIEAEMSQKADIDGSYPLLHAGTADNLIADTGATQAIPFIQEGTGKGNGEATVKAGRVLQLKKKLGNTVAVNQAQKTQALQATGTVSGVIFTNTGTAAHISGTADADIGTAYFDRTDYATNTIPGHTYLLFGCPASGGSNKFYLEPLIGAGADWCKGYPRDVGSGVIFVAKKTNDTPDYIYGIRLYIVNGAANLNADVNCYLIDLDRWFGSPDRIPADLLSHPENWGRYYAGSLAHNAGTLDSPDGTVLKSIGRNVWDEEWEVGGINLSTGQNVWADNKIRSTNYIPVIPNTAYYAKAKLTNGVLFYGADKTYLGQNYVAYPNNATFTTPSNAYYMRFVVSDTYGTTYNHDLTISLYYSGESGYDQYYPFSVLAEVDTGSEVLRSAGAVADEKTPDGTITRRCAIVNIADLSFSYNSSYDYFYCDLPAMKSRAANEGPGYAYIQSDKYVFMGRGATSALQNANYGEMFYFGGGWDTSQVRIKATTTPSSGVIIYELATPATEQGTAFAENIPCDPDGTLNWTQSAGVPQGNEIFYPADLKGALDSIVAALPSANGTYTLHATVTTAGVTFSWS